MPKKAPKKASDRALDVAHLPDLGGKIAIGLHELPTDADEVLLLGKGLKIGLGHPLVQNVGNEVSAELGKRADQLLCLGFQSFEATAGFPFLAHRTTVDPIHFILRHGQEI